VKDFYIKNYKTLKKEIEEDTRRWKDLLCSRRTKNQWARGGKIEEVLEWVNRYRERMYIVYIWAVRQHCEQLYAKKLNIDELDQF
jgi:hypothetical protein